MIRMKAIICAVLLSAGAVAASEDGAILLTVEAPSGQSEFDLGMLQSLPAVTIETETIWTDGLQTFTGVPLTELTRKLGVDSGILQAMAINNYAVEIPVSDAVDGGPIVAYERNGAPMSVRDKGPLWIVYPYDSNPDYRSEEIYSRSIWQLEKITHRP
jgi:hypothetical protein